MERKGNSTVAVTAEEIRAALPKARTLTSEEEKGLRMRHGVGVTDLRAPLPRAAESEELQDELLLLEMQLLRAHRAHLAKAKAKPASPARPALDPAGARAKDKIVRALRKKK